MNTSMQVPTISTTSKTIGTLLEDICMRSDGRETTVVACCSRAYFLKQILVHANSTSSPEVQDDTGEGAQQRDGVVSTGADSMIPQTPAFLLPTLLILAMSSRTTLAFCPSITSFRGYMSTLLLHHDQQSPDLRSRVIVLDMLALHHGTSEFTVQGLSRTFAMLASIHHSINAGIQLIECNTIDESSSERGPRLWDAEVPLLSGSVKIGEAGQGWATRTISIRKFAERWFRFEG